MASSYGTNENWKLGTKENFCMATVLLFWNTNIADMTSCENVLLAGEPEVAGDWGDWVSDASNCIMGPLQKTIFFSHSVLAIANNRRNYFSKTFVE